MSHANADHYAAKHTSDTPLNPAISEAVQRYADSGKITCVDAHQIAKELDVSPLEVGVTIDLLEIRISHCQLGLFERKRKPTEEIVQEKNLSQDIRVAVKAAQQEGYLSCAQAWAIAEQLGIKKRDVGAACNVLQVKIMGCQLGTF